MEVINSFRGDYKEFGNFFLIGVTYEGLYFKSSENAFQAAKIYIHEDSRKTNLLRIEAGFTVIGPKEAKIVGKSSSIQLRDDWNKVKNYVMYYILENKFYQNPELLKKLINTYPKVLIEGNHWHDNYWGNCYCAKCSHLEGGNILGKLLMQLREKAIQI